MAAARRPYNACVRYHLLTLGCAKNVADSRRLESLLARNRHRPAVTPEQADVLIVNTCGFIDAAKEESLNAILALATRKRPGQRLLVAGCLAALYGNDVAREISEVDATFGAEAWDAILGFLGPPAPGGDGVRYHLPERDGRHVQPSAYLKIADGCNAPCSFCVIPKMKGPLHSTPPEQVTADARRLAAAGARELVLVAQDTTDYGRDLGLRDGLPDLLEALSAAVPNVWLRVMYAYPGHITSRLARTMAALPNVCHYLDIPLQHGSEAVLRRMRRPFHLSKVRETLDGLRAAMPDIALRTTFLVGYPGETDAEFEEMLRFLEEQRFDHVGAFMFSPQPFTPAGNEPDQVPEPVKRRRHDALMRLARTIARERNREWVGRELDVLVETPAGVRPDGLCAGRSFRDAPEVDGTVLFAGDAQAGDFVRVRVTEALDYDLVGEAVGASAAV